MADQRPAFRFRLPWLPAGQAPRPAVAPRPATQPSAATTGQRTTPQTAATPQRPPTQPVVATDTSSTATQAAENQEPSGSQTATATASSTPTVQTAETEAPPPPQSTIETASSSTAGAQAPETQPRAAERPPFRPPGVAPPSPQLQTSRTQSQPPQSPSRSTTQPRVPSSQPASPGRAATQSRAPSQPSTPQPRAVSLPSSPSRRSPQIPSKQPRSPSRPAIRPSENTSAPPSPSRSIAQEQSTTEAVNQQTSTLKGEESLTKESSQPSESSTESTKEAGNQLTSTLEGDQSLTKESSRPSESSTGVVSSISDIQSTKEADNQLTSTLKGDQSQTKESSQTSESSTEVVSSISDTQPPKSAISESPKPETISEVFDGPRDKAPHETGNQLDEKVKQSSEEESWIGAAKTSSQTEAQETPVPTQISHDSTVHPEPESFPKALKPDETREVKEVMPGAKEEEYEEARNKTPNIPEELGNTEHIKDVAFQSEQTQKTASRKDVTTSSPNGKQTKTTTAEPKTKNMPVDNRQKLPVSNEVVHKGIRDEISKLVHTVSTGESKQPTDDRPVSVITLAGENRGATMHLGSESSRKEGAVHIHRGYMLKPDESAEATDGEENFKTKSTNSKAKEDQAPEAYVNSNVQAINNSIMFNSSITERNPGVHFFHSNFPTESKTPSAKPELLETLKAEYNVTPSRKLTHEPVVRRRCLRGLFLESSDSDPDSTKPRSHGCRVGCYEKKKENNIDVL